MKQLLIYLIIIANSLHAQSVFGPVGAEAWAMGASNVAASNSFCIQNNVAGMVWLNKPDVSVYNEIRYRLSNLSFSNINVVLPFTYCHIGFGINYFGYNLYNQQKFNIAIAKKLSNQFSIGVSMALFGINISENSQAYTYVTDVGLQYKVNKKIRFGLSVFNPTQSKISDNNNFKIPVYARMGAAYELSDKLIYNIEFEKVLSQMDICRTGFSYQAHKYFALRAGIASNPLLFTFGVGSIYNKLKIDMAASYHQVLGVTPHVSLTYAFAN